MSKLEDAVRSKTTYLDVILTVFIILKLTGLIDWSWWWVLSPMWGVFALFLIAAVIVKLLED